MQFSHLEGQPLTVSSQTYGTADYNFSSAEGLVQAPASASTDNLYNEYYSRYVSEISNPNTRILTVKMLLNSSDINTFEFTDVITIKNRRYRVNRIDYKPHELSTVEFILIP